MGLAGTGWPGTGLLRVAGIVGLAGNMGLNGYVGYGVGNTGLTGACN